MRQEDSKASYICLETTQNPRDLIRKYGYRSLDEVQNVKHYKLKSNYWSKSTKEKEKRIPQKSNIHRETVCFERKGKGKGKKNTLLNK